MNEYKIPGDATPLDVTEEREPNYGQVVRRGFDIVRVYWDGTEVDLMPMDEIRRMINEPHGIFETAGNPRFVGYLVDVQAPLGVMANYPQDYSFVIQPMQLCD